MNGSGSGSGRSRSGSWNRPRVCARFGECIRGEVCLRGGAADPAGKQSLDSALRRPRSVCQIVAEAAAAGGFAPASGEAVQETHCGEMIRTSPLAPLRVEVFGPHHRLRSFSSSHPPERRVSPAAGEKRYAREDRRDVSPDPAGRDRVRVLDADGLRDASAKCVAGNRAQASALPGFVDYFAPALGGPQRLRAGVEGISSAGCAAPRSLGSSANGFGRGRRQPSRPAQPGRGKLLCALRIRESVAGSILVADDDDCEAVRGGECARNLL